MSKNLKIQKLDQGFSLVEVMVAVSILGFLSVVMFTMINMQLSQMNHYEFLGKREQLRATIVGQFLSNPNNCKCLFNGASDFPVAGVKNLTGYAQPTAVGLYNVPACTMAYPFVSQAGVNDVRLTSVAINNITQVAGTQTGELVVGIRNAKAVSGMEVQPIRIPVRIKTEPTGSPAILRFDGCSSSGGNDLESLLLTVEPTTTDECLWNDSVNVLIAQCPPDRALIACSGGPGDQDESQEGHWIVPNYANNSCELHVAMPRCNGETILHTRQKVVASCYLRP